MDRRLVLGGLIVAAATPAFKAAFAQTGGSLSAAQKQHIENTMKVGSLSLALSRTAHPKLEHSAVKQFSTFEIAEQETIGNILAIKLGKMPNSGTVTPPSEAEVMAALDAEGKAMVEKMREEKAGAAYDAAYVTAQIQGHQKLLAFQEEYLKVADQMDETNVAKLAMGMIKEHLALLSGLQRA